MLRQYELRTLALAGVRVQQAQNIATILYINVQLIKIIVIYAMNNCASAVLVWAR